jgi:hypothetical protein
MLARKRKWQCTRPLWVLFLCLSRLRETFVKGGEFDYQRVHIDNAPYPYQQVPELRDVANFNVGLLAQQAGLSLNQILTIAGLYANRYASNKKPGSPYGLDPESLKLTVLGYNTGASGVYDK